jgi:hypothetical protein
MEKKGCKEEKIAFEGLGKDEDYVGEHGTLGEEEDKERTR